MEEPHKIPKSKKSNKTKICPICQKSIAARGLSGHINLVHRQQLNQSSFTEKKSIELDLAIKQNEFLTKLASELSKENDKLKLEVRKLNRIISRNTEPVVIEYDEVIHRMYIVLFISNHLFGIDDDKNRSKSELQNYEGRVIIPDDKKFDQSQKLSHSLLISYFPHEIR